MLRKRAYFMKEELRLAFEPKRFWGALLLLFLCFNGFSLPNWLNIYDWDPEFRGTSLMLTIGGIFFGGVMLIMPLCASIPMAPLQVDELRTSFVDWRIFRGSIRLYTLRKVTARVCQWRGCNRRSLRIGCDPLEYPRIAMHRNARFLQRHSICGGLYILFLAVHARRLAGLCEHDARYLLLWGHMGNHRLNSRCFCAG